MITDYARVNAGGAGLVARNRRSTSLSACEVVICRSFRRSRIPPTGGESRLAGHIWDGATTQGRTHMTEFAGRTAVVTGGGSGMGRELVRQLVAEACNVAMCDVSPTGLAETQKLCEAAGLPQGLRVTTHIADVADRSQVERFRDEVADRHQTDKIHLLFNNAGISGGGSMITNSRDEWERTFNICWGGVYNCTRAFLPMLQNAEEGTSSTPAASTASGPRLDHASRTPPIRPRNSR